MKYLQFNNGDNFPMVGLGTWKATDEEVKNAVKTAINKGYTHIDTASIYNNEEAIGEALQEVFNEGNVKREDLFITSKLWNDAHHPENVIPAIEESLRKLQLDYLDLYLIHWPVAFKHGVPMPSDTKDYVSLEEVPISETWKQMEAIKENGLSKHIGVSNFSKKKLEDLLGKASHTPEVNQIELHPLLQQKELKHYCDDHHIHLTAYSPLGSGDRHASMKADDEPSLFEIDTIQQIAQKHQVHPASVLLNWHVQRGSAVIPKSTNPKNIESNLKAVDLELDASDMEAIDGLDKNYRFITGKFFEAPDKGYVNIYDE